MSETDCNKWEEAYLGQTADAAVGRLFRGLLHNLNGTIQALSMQGELIGMLLPNMGKKLAEVAAAKSLEGGREIIEDIRATLTSRAGMLEQMGEKVKTAQDILRRTSLLTEVTDPGSKYTVESVIRCEVEFRMADYFFKHQVKKELRLASGLPPVRRLAIELHQVVFVLLVNGSEALQNQVAVPRLLIEAKVRGDQLIIAVEDNGPGIAAADQPRIFEPFFTTRRGHVGLGLYLAKKIIDRCNGKILCTSTPGSTRFQLEIPSHTIGASN
jgi:signal transduction histidine kinase